MKIKYIILLFAFLIVIIAKANQSKVDSLVEASFSEKNDSTLLYNYNKIGSLSYKRNQQFAKKYWLQALSLGEKLVKQDTAAYYKNQLATSYNGMGIISRREGKYPEALSYYQKCLKTESSVNSNESGTTLMNIGVIYREMGEFEQALSYVNEALDMAVQRKSKESYSSCYNGLGMIYRRMKNYDKALECYQLSLDASIEIDDQDNIAQSYNNIGAVYYTQKKYDVALEYLNKGYQIHLSNNNEAGIVRHHSNMLSYYKKIGNINKALEVGKKAYDKYQEMGRKVELYTVSRQLSDLYAKNKSFEKSLFYYKKYVALKDSVFNENTTREVTQKEMQFKFDKQLMADSLARAEQEKIKELEHQQQLKQKTTFMYAGGIILLIVIVFSSIIFNRLKITKKQKSTIEEQKLMVEEKNKEITDSINYAKRIQTAILPSVEKIKQTLPNTFVLYKPKDIVAGDFYWYTKKAGKTLIAVADCTGHGVPGAMVSVVCNNALNRAVNDFNLFEPAKILDKTAELVIEAFKQHNENVKDGMDISLCSFNEEKNEVEYAGAINSLFYISENKLTELKGNRQPIGQYGDIKPFTNHKISLNKGDSVYMFSDGYQDQFGGEKGKKYMYKRFRELVLGISNLEFSKQKEQLEKEFKEWKGNIEQVDDVCVIGVRI